MRLFEDDKSYEPDQKTRIPVARYAGAPATR